MKNLIFSLATAAMVLSGCNTKSQIIVPLSQSVELETHYQIIWDGVGKAYKYNNGKWLRAESYDYQFNVVQNRMDNQWKSVKTLQRLHPDYDGRAGNRYQTMYFEVTYQKAADGKVAANITSTLGNGSGTTDTEFRNSILTMDIGGSKFMPYNKCRITQHYDYEEGKLTETVELYKEKDGQEIPFMKNEETAFIFIKSKLDKAPTIFK